MSIEEINQIVEENHNAYGLKKSDLNNQVLKASNAITKAEFFNGTQFQENWEYTKDHLIKTEILTYPQARDVGIVMAIFSRETGPINYRFYRSISSGDLENTFVTSGADVHKNGIAGFDFILSGGQKTFHTKNYKDAGISYKSVDPSEFKSGKTIQRPARIKIRDFMFSAFSMIAFCNKRLRQEIDGYDELTVEAQRVWVALFFAGSGYAKHMIKTIKTHCSKESIELDYNLIVDSAIESKSNWQNTNARLRNARRISLKAMVFDSILKLDFITIDFLNSLTKLKELMS